MDFLKNQFEEQLELSTTTKGDVVIGETVFTPVSILKADPTAYENEFDNWRDDVWLPRQAELLEEILVTHANRNRFSDLCNTLSNGQLIPLIGSGMSVPSGFDQWTDFLRAIRVHSSMREADLEAMLANWQYEEAAEAVAASMPGRLFDERIEHDLRVDNPDSIVGAVQFVPELFNKLVLTTNLDDLLEHLYRRCDRSFSHTLCGRTIGDYRRVKATAERVLLKFHGDCRTRDGRVLGKREYDVAYSNGSPIKEELSTIYRNHSLLCLGCSLNPDRTVSLLAEVARIDQGMPKHYAFLKIPSDADKLREREHFLTERDVFPIWYPGDHNDSIQALFVGMLQHIGRL